MPENSKLEESELITLAQSGDRKAFEELVALHQTKILALAYRLLGDVREARELAADTFAEAFRALKRFRREAKFGTWLYRIALNLGFKRLRKMGRERALFVSRDEPASEDESRETEATSEPSPLEALELEETHRQIRLVLAQLSKDHAQILILHDVEGLSYAEISASLKCPLGTVMSRLNRAREAFRKAWNSLKNP